MRTEDDAGPPREEPPPHPYGTPGSAAGALADAAAWPRPRSLLACWATLPMLWSRPGSSSSPAGGSGAPRRARKDGHLPLLAQLAVQVRCEELGLAMPARETLHCTDLGDGTVRLTAPGLAAKVVLPRGNAGIDVTIYQSAN